MDLIIGAGVSGIAFANFSQGACLIIEKEGEAGGYCRTIKRNGFTWDYSGHFFHFQNPELEAYVRKNIDPKEIRVVQKDTSILYRNQYIDFPFQKNIHQLPQEEFIDCLYDLFAPREGGEVHSFKEMVYDNLGKSISDKFLIPYNEKLYACDLNILDKEAMGRFFPKADKEEIILNFRNKDKASYNQSFVYPRGGAIEYIHSLLKNIPETPVSYHEELLRIDIHNKIAVTNQREIPYTRLISTLPFPLLLQKCGITYKNVFSSNKVLVLNIGFDRKGRDNHTSWLYIPDRESVFYRIGFYDNIMDTDRLSVYVEIGFPSDAVLESDEYYLERVLNDMRRCHLITDEQVVDYEVVLMDPAYVHVNRQSMEAVLYYKKQLEEYAIYSIGRYGSWTYCSIEDNILEAKMLAVSLNGEWRN